MRRRHVAPAGAVLAAVLATFSCAPVVPWGTEAQDWITAFDAAFDAGTGEHVVFATVDVVVDSRMAGSEHSIAEGRARAALLGVAAPRPRVTGDLFLGTEDAVRTVAWVWNPKQINQTLEHLHIGPDGIDRVLHLQATWYGPGWSSPPRPTGTAADEVAARYVEAWRSADPDALAALYAPEATIADSVLGIGLVGIEAIQAQDAVPLRRLTVAEAFGDLVPTAPGVAEAGALPMAFHYVSPAPEGDTLTQVWVPVTTDDPCPGAVVVALEVDDRLRVVAERRFHEVEVARECWSTAELGVGWWTGRGLPVPLAERVTGQVEVGDLTVEMRNGTPLTEEFVAWGLAQFTAAGLPLPQVASVALDPFDPCCRASTGSAHWDGCSTGILLCDDASAIGTAIAAQSADGATALLGTGEPAWSPSSRALLLHELGHAWVNAWVDDETRAELIASVGAESWNDEDTPWGSRGSEWAAETLAWGLGGGGDVPARLDGATDQLLVETWTLLTGTALPAHR